MDDRTQSKSTRQTETAEEEAGPPTKWSRPGGKGEGHGEQDRDKETDKPHPGGRPSGDPGSAFPAARGTRAQGLLPGRKGTRTTGGKDGAAGAAEIEWTTRS